MRDQEGNPLANPKFREAPQEGEEDQRTQEEKEEFLKEPSFDYFFKIIKNPQAPSLITLLAMYIQQNDRIGFFN